jgi:uncharacterized protein (DUF488 family)
MGDGQVFTIGHGGQTWAGVAATLKSANVQFLIDVRSVPYSKFQPDFTRMRLEHLARGTAKYVFMGDLLGGRPDDVDCYTEGHVDYVKTQAKDFFKRGIARLLNAYTQGLNVCLLCSEAQPSQCHRTKLIGVALASHGVKIAHLLPTGVSRSQEAVMREITGGQEDLFGRALRSRKAYR